MRHVLKHGHGCVPMHMPVCMFKHVPMHMPVKQVVERVLEHVLQ